jgi:hypothetical protein
MTTYFVSNSGSNTSPFDTEAKAATTLAGAMAVAVAGDTVKVSSTHTETAGAALTYTFPTTPGLQVLCVTFNGSGTGALNTGGSMNVGAANSAMSIASGFAYIYGLTFAGGTNNNTACKLNIESGTAATNLVFESCTFSAPSANASGSTNVGASGSASNTECSLEFINCTFSNGGAGHVTSIRNGNIKFDNLALAGTAQTTLFQTNAGNVFNVLFTGCDLSNLAWTNLMSVAGGGTGVIVFRQCKMRSGFTTTTGSWVDGGSFDLILQDCDSGDNHYTFTKNNYFGTITTSSSVYADASDGTDSMSWLMASSANAKFQTPLVSPQIVTFNSAIGSGLTSTVETNNDGTTFKNNELWQETLAKVTSGFPLGTWNKGSRAADITNAGSSQSTSTKTWTGTGGFGAAVRQKLVSSSFTPQEVGPIATVVKLAKASASVYVSPRVAIA